MFVQVIPKSLTLPSSTSHFLTSIKKAPSEQSYYDFHNFRKITSTLFKYEEKMGFKLDK